MAEKRKELSTDVKNIIVSLRNEGYTLQHIADTLNICCETVSHVIVWFKKRGITKNKPWSDQPPILDARDERCLARLFGLTVKILSVI